MIIVFGQTFEHLTILRSFGNPIYAYMVQAESGYCIRLDLDTGTIYKTITMIYETDDFSTITVIPESEVPEGEEICGGIETETM